MVTAKESQNCQQFSAKNPPGLSHMALQLYQNYSLQYFPPSAFTTNVAVPGHSPEFPGVNACQRNAFGGSSKLLPSYWDISYPNGNPYDVKDSHFGLGVSDAKPIDTSQRRFLIFDQSGNHTRLFVSPSFSPQHRIIASKTDDAFANNGSYEKLAPLVDHELSEKPVVEEKWDENDPSDGEGDEMLEDSEEINALLYSDSDDDAYDEKDDGDKNDEVTSMRRTPFAIDEGFDKYNLLDEEEVASSGGSPKRQRLLDGGYKKSSLVCDESPANKRASACSYEDDLGSSCNIDSSNREKKVKVRDALKILESIIPGLKSNDPLSVIDHAIGYLKSMKIEAEALGLGCPESNPATFA